MRKERTEIEVKSIRQNNGQLSWLPKNPRQWTQTDIDRTVTSIQEDTDFLEDRPLLLVPGTKDGQFIVFAGNLRYTASKKLQLLKVPAVLYYPETEDDQLTVKRRAMKDNGTFGAWDMDALANEWDDLPLVDWGIPAWEPEDLPGDKPEETAEEDDFNPDEQDIPDRCKPGDIWQLGEHRLMCGDSTDRDAVLKLTGGTKIDLSLTDPPYGIAIVKNQGKIGGDKPATFGTTINDWDRKKFGKEEKDGVIKATVYHEIKGDETTDTARLSFAIMQDVSRNQIIFGGNYFTDFLPPKPCWIVWDKQNGESVFADIEMAWTSFETGARLFQWMWNGMARKGDRKTEGERRMHPTQKPVGLMGKILTEFGKEGETVLDLFGGSGSTLIAAEQLHRSCYMMEYEPYYCNVILSRWEHFTGKVAELIVPGEKAP